MEPQATITNTNLPDSFFSLLAQICRGFFRNFGRNLLKALTATAIAILLPEFLAWIESLDLIDSRLMSFLYEFAISPQNLLRGCLFSSMFILTGISLIEKFWANGLVKSVGRFLRGAAGWLNIIRNTRTTAFTWGIAIGFCLGWPLENTILSLTLFSATFIAGVIPENSGLIYFARFFWNRFLESCNLNTALKPADEFMRGISPGILVGIGYKTQNADAQLFAGFAGAVFLLWLIAFFRQKRGTAHDS